MKPEAFIIYVENLARSRYFYEKVLGLKIRLDAGTYVEFDFNGAGLGLMPKESLKGFLGKAEMQEWKDSAPRCELYFLTDRIGETINKLFEANAECLSPIEMRPWGDEVAYFKDPDGHIIAVGRRTQKFYELTPVTPSPEHDALSPSGLTPTLRREPAGNRVNLVVESPAPVVQPAPTESEIKQTASVVLRWKMAKVTKAHKTSFPEPIKIRKGEKLKTMKKKSEWPGWFWCVNSAKKGGWVPKSALSIKNKTAVALTNYDASELNVNEGEELVVLSQESGWCWCANEKGSRGWVPSENLKLKD